MPRHRAEGGGGALRRDQRDPAADPDAEALRQPVADSDAVVAEIGERAGDDLLGERAAARAMSSGRMPRTSAPEAPAVARSP